MTDPVSGPRLAESADVGAFLARLVRLDPAAPIRLRPDGSTRIALWARLPWDVLVTRAVAGQCGQDLTVGAADLLGRLANGELTLAHLARRDDQWRGPLPPVPVVRVDSLPAAELRRLDVAAARTLRALGHGGADGRVVGQRVLRDALLDHVPVTVSTERGQVPVPQRLVQAVLRMGFLAPTDQSTDDPNTTESTGGRDMVTTAPTGGRDMVAVLTAGRWVGLAGAYGTAWHHRGDRLTVLRIDRPNG